MDVIQVSVDTVCKIARPVLGKIFLLLDNSVYAGLVIILRYKPGSNIPRNDQKYCNQNNAGSAVFHYTNTVYALSEAYVMGWYWSSKRFYRLHQKAKLAKSHIYLSA